MLVGSGICGVVTTASDRWTTDHPRVRGEQALRDLRPLRAGGSSPRARGAARPHPRIPWRVRIIPARARGAEQPARARAPVRGIIPACAGSRPGQPRPADRPTDHPRVRGEQVCGGHGHHLRLGSSPRARGAVLLKLRKPSLRRIIPACAGSRRTRGCRRPPRRDHPRVRGEQAGPDVDRRNAVGSPPHARGAGLETVYAHGAHRITPACAGSSPCRPWPSPARSDHPRMRGEQYGQPGEPSTTPGSPPHARGAARVPSLTASAQGITPACAGSSRRQHLWVEDDEDHPRMRGEQGGILVADGRLIGSPPHARGAG
jgi:hypothetical protein